MFALPVDVIVAVANALFVPTFVAVFHIIAGTTCVLTVVNLQLSKPTNPGKLFPATSLNAPL
jgi:hypothetical protein